MKWVNSFVSEVPISLSYENQSIDLQSKSMDWFLFDRDLLHLSFKWFDDNLMKSNADKCHLLVSTNETVKIQVGNYNIANSKCEKLLGINFDHNLNFDKHLSELCKKVSRKINALSRITPYMNVSKKRILMNAFFKSQFSYCPLI